MIQKNEYNVDLLERSYFETLSEKLNISYDAFIQKFNGQYLYTVTSAFNNLKDPYKEVLEKLLTIQNKNDYFSFIYDENSEIGKANIKTKEIFAQNGLSINKWLNLDNNSTQLERNFKLKNSPQLKIKLWERNPGYDLFQGSYTDSCFALNSVNREGIIDALANISMQLADIKDGDKTIGTIYMYWARNQANNELMLVIDAIDLDRGYRVLKSDKADDPNVIVKKENNIKIRSEAVEFVKSFAKDVAGKDVAIVLGEKYQHVFTDDLKPQKLDNQPVQFIGDCASFKQENNTIKELFINSYNGRKDITKVQKINYFSNL